MSNQQPPIIPGAEESLLEDESLQEPEAPPAPAPVAQKKKRGPVFWLFVTVLIVAGGAWLVNFTYRAMVFEETDDAYIDGHVHQVSSRVAGSVTEVLVKENEVVKAGQVLARIDPLEFEIALEKE